MIFGIFVYRWIFITFIFVTGFAFFFFFGVSKIDFYFQNYAFVREYFFFFLHIFTYVFPNENDRSLKEREKVG